MRIVAGSARGRALQGPKPTSRHIRPTADRVRETLFNVLGQWLEGQAVLDLYAGTGALGLEALSRGAGRAVLVDSDREAQALCRQNTDTLGFSSQVELLCLPVARAVEQLGQKGLSFELIFADPPYAVRGVEGVLEQVARSKLLTPGGMLVVEHDKREVAPGSHEGLERVDQRKFGDTVASFYRNP
ncbi:16S rRNA (guanine(966)-N(2))-methyltransferase RsmD [Stigmatella aurantiaca]|uniref:Methyltransferase n=1 Tax=Stigmatella aurantiaca (strain DW4/3-1) TaxID=378806 RepID=Q091Y6_STIAD|nr:16S rRNA (guanine(966)-N(2))-methyltransferase RsmD [Stigmatella aurantiaca]ADO71643.1 methyltransferase [Stigmatella aurantiaca DW4/3-1]EAU66536.1 putative methyltransferase [Stigmatella aurantiaca DW4/3-1]